MLGVRISSFGETGLGEPEQDANSALTELDKALRSEKIGEQCEAIVRFPRLFEKYPFPILINSSLLKLADVFRVGNNFLRLWVLRVCQQSEKHLDKIINVDEFVRRIFSVIHSNDPVARALTLRTLGSVAGIIPERQQVHHSIRRSLDSHDMVEVEAATYAAMQFAAQSKTFAVSMCSKISDMIRGLSTPAHMKLQLIPILQHMHHDIGTAAMVRQLCADLLPSYPAEEFVLVTLNTLTQLAGATLVDIPSQVTLLLGYLRSDPRWTVKAQCLRNLHRLATHGSHLWPQDAVDAIIAVAEDPPNEQVLAWALDTLLAVAKSAAAVETQVHAESRLFRLCADVSLSAAPHIASKAVQVVTRLVCHGTGLEDADRLSDAVDLVESLLLLVATGQARGELRACLHCAVSLCRSHQQLCPRVIALVSSTLSRSTDPELLPPLCEALAAVADRGPRGSLLPALPALLDTLGRTRAGTENSQATVMLCTLVFQTLTGFRWTDQPGCLDDRLNARQAIERVVAGNNLWANYRIARSAARYGRHGVSADISRRLLAHVSSEHLHFWLAGLRELSDGEFALADRQSTPGLADRLALTMTHYCRAVAALKAGSSPAGSLQFQTEYARLRGEFLQSLAQLVHACHSLCTTPPPAVATAVPESNLQRYGHVTNQLRKCVKEFRVCGDLYWKLYQTAFDADLASLAHIQILQQMCVLMAHSVERVAQANYQDDVVLDFSCEHAGLEATYMIRCCQEAASVAQQMVWAEEQKTITHQHIECLLKQVEILADTALCLPRYFFQVLQSTTLTLMVTPKPRVLGESISVSSSAQLAIKVEGVVQHGKRPGLFRSIGGVRVTVSSQLQKQHAQDSKARPEGDSLLAQTVAPHRDFFAAAFLLAFPTGGQYVLAVEAALVDEAGNVWRTGPRTSLSVKSVEDGKAAAQPGNSKFSSPRF